jgi:hypothetical protein
MSEEKSEYKIQYSPSNHLNLYVPEAVSQVNFFYVLISVSEFFFA